MPVHMHMDSKQEDIQLRFLDLCENYQTQVHRLLCFFLMALGFFLLRIQMQVETNASAYADYHMFLQGNEFETVAKLVGAKLNVGKDPKLDVTADEVLLAFEACAYDIILEDGNQVNVCYMS